MGAVGCGDYSFARIDFGTQDCGKGSACSVGQRYRLHHGKTFGNRKDEGEKEKKQCI